MSKHTPGPWRLLEGAQGPYMVMHPTRKGVAIASLTEAFKPINGFHEDWGDDNSATNQVTIQERNANARLIAASPEMLDALKKWERFMLDNYSESDISWWAETRDAIAKAEGR